jgi:hypothetical protein
MPRTKVVVPNVAEAEPGPWTNGIRAGDLLFISGQVARPFDGANFSRGTSRPRRWSRSKSSRIWARNADSPHFPPIGAGRIRE